MITLLHAWVATLALIGSVEQAQLDQLIQASSQLKPGDDQARVLAVLGRPRARWQRRGPIASFVLGGSQPRWAYGTHLDLSAIIVPDSPFPNVLPIKLRLFGPDEEDLVIIWNADGSVASIERP
jgi:hypothetical protein